MRKPFLYVIIPALNEAPNLGRLFGDLADMRRELAGEMTLRVVLVDDGSDDGTADEARAAARGVNLLVVRHEHPEGPGRAFASGFAAIAPLLTDDDYVLTLEADNTSRLDIFRLMLTRSREGYDVIFASPYAYGGAIVGTNRTRTIVSHIANSIVKGLLDVRGILTVSSFYRLYRGKAVRTLQGHYGRGIIECSGFECMVEVVLKLIYLRMTISEVPMILDGKQRIGRSKMRMTRTALGYLRLFWRKRRWRHVVPGVLEPALEPAAAEQPTLASV